MSFSLPARPSVVAALLLSLAAVPALAAPPAKRAPVPAHATAAGRCARLALDGAVAGCFHGRVAKRADHEDHPKGGPNAADPDGPTVPPPDDYDPRQSSTIDPNGAHGGPLP